MKTVIIILSALSTTLSAIAQSETTDSIKTQALQEIVIQAPKVIRKPDMDVYHPSKSAVENSKNGLQLLENLMIPSLNVNDPLGTVMAAGQSVQIRINGRESTIDQVRALLPETIKRVEWIDNPGLRYRGANYVINFIVTNPTTGGSVVAKAQPILNAAFGFYFADAKFNIGRSQWEIGAHYKLTNKMHMSRDYVETFTYPDGNSLIRKETPISGRLDNPFGGLSASYNYIKPDTTIFMAEFGLSHKFNDYSSFKGLLSLSDDSNDILLTDIHGDKGSQPTLSLYLQQNFPKKQTLVLNFNSSFYLGKTFSDYIEQTQNPLTFLTDVTTHINDQNQVYALEADYIKYWKKSRFTTGVSYTANLNRSEYKNLNGTVFHQSQNKVYAFAEYFQNLGKWSLTAGIGVQYTDFRFKETDTGNHSWSPRPQLTISYALNQNHNFRLNFTSWQSSPSLAETNIVPQQLDGFQWLIGNQSLKTANSYMLTFNYGFNLPHISGSFGIRAFTSPNAITPILFWEEDKLITSYENSRGLQNLSIFLAPQIEIIKNWLTISGYIQYRIERMRGTGYSFHNNDLSGNVQFQLSHWGFILSGQYIRAQRKLWGEKISWGEDVNMIELDYNWKAWQFGVGIIMPFGKYDQGNKSLSKWNRNEQHLRLQMRMPYISISYNLQWGRQKRESKKLINSDANVDKSSVGTR